MTLTEARVLTSKRMRFGDLAQIEAVKLLEGLAAALEVADAEKWRVCPDCDGEKIVPECGQCLEADQCEACAGKWLMACPSCGERGLTGAQDIDWPPVSIGEFAPDVLDAVVCELRVRAAEQARAKEEAKA